MNVAVLHAESANIVQPDAVGPQAEAVTPAPDSAAGSLPESFPAESSWSESPASASGTAAKRAYPAAAELPTQEGPAGLRFDFNDGCRVTLAEAAHPWRVRLSDLDTGNILFDTELQSGRVNSSKRYYVRFRVEARQRIRS